MQLQPRLDSNKFAEGTHTNANELTYTHLYIQPGGEGTSPLTNPTATNYQQSPCQTPHLLLLTSDIHEQADRTHLQETQSP